MWTFIELFWAEFKTKTLGNINHSSINYWLGGWIVLPYIDFCLIYPMDNLEGKEIIWKEKGGRDNLEKQVRYFSTSHLNLIDLFFHLNYSGPLCLLFILCADVFSFLLFCWLLVPISLKFTAPWMLPPTPQ